MNENKWVAESDWSKVKRGDLVRVKNGTDSAEFVVTRPVNNWESKFLGTSQNYYHKNDGWSLFVEAPPAVVLPTEPGNYLDKDGTAWRITARFPFREDLHARHAPFTRLEPVPETAKKVLDRVLAMTEAVAGCGTISPNVHRAVDEVVKRLHAEFGVEVDK